jgi:hypothetical protein
VVVPGVWLSLNASPLDTGFTFKGGALSTVAGILGALGALGVVFALRAAGRDSALYVAPIVFAGAPIVNVLISYVIELLNGRGQLPHPMFFVGLLLAIVGTASVLIYSPAVHAAPPSAATRAAPSAATATTSPTAETHH